MSELVLPGYLAEEKAAAQTEADTVRDTAAAALLPTPCGYKMLISLAAVDEKYDSGLLKAGSVVQQDEVASVIGFVLKMGPDCYLDKDKFPTGPFCKEGDFILLRTYSGTRFKIRGVEFRLISDDTVEAVVLDPRGYSRA